MLRIEEKTQEVLAIVRKSATVDDMLAQLPDLKAILDNLTQPEARTNLRSLSPNTLRDLLTRLKANPELLATVDDQPALTRLWTSHKPALGFSADQLAEAEDIWSGLAEGLGTEARQLAEDLATESGKKQAMLAKFGLGNDLSDAIKASLAQKSGPLFESLAGELGLSPAELAQYDVLTEIPLTTTSGYMKTDVLLVKRNLNGAVIDAIIVENKLSLRSPFTKRQIEGFGAILNGKTQMNLPCNAGGLTVNEIIPVSKVKIFRFADHGQNSLEQVQIFKITSVK